MAYEHGSLDLGIRNPFRLEGIIRALRGFITTCLGLYVLLQVPAAVAEDPVLGWITISVSFILLSNGLWTVGSGLMQTLRFFVGRSAPTSLAFNQAKSEAETANAEKRDLAYDSDQLEQMLVGRKNLTFTEPKGLISRLIHTLFPKLTFVPYPIRNMALQLSDTLVQTAIAMVAFALSNFVMATGLIGDYTRFIQPVVSTLFLTYLILIWFHSGSPISRQVSASAKPRGAVGLTRTLILAVTFPIAANFLVSSFIASQSKWREPEWLAPIDEIRHNGTAATMKMMASIGDNVSSMMWIFAIAGFGLISFGLLSALIAKRCNKANPTTEVSELRENWQESVHPREIFINLDSIVMANRRYKEVPNRIYRSLQPMLKEQSNGKGAFYGETIQETQPRVKTTPVIGLPKHLRIIGTTLGQILMLACALTLFVNYDIVLHLADIFVIGKPEIVRGREAMMIFATDLGEQIAILINALFSLLIFGVFGRLLTNLTHVFWSELQFESELLYFKCEGTYTESTISTGKGIFDSTESKNVIVRSSMTPWVITSRAVSSVFAGVGSKNLEQPRHLMELHSSDEEIHAITNDLLDYLASRQTIANLNTDADVAAAAQIHEFNQQTRAAPQQQIEMSAATVKQNNQLERQESLA